MGNVVNLQSWKAKQAQIERGYRLAAWNRAVLERQRRWDTIERIKHTVETQLGMSMLQFAERTLDVYVMDGIEPTKYIRRRG